MRPQQPASPAGRPIAAVVVDPSAGGTVTLYPDGSLAYIAGDGPSDGDGSPYPATTAGLALSR